MTARRPGWARAIAAGAATTVVLATAVAATIAQAQPAGAAHGSPLPTENGLASVSCPSPAWCMAVGSAQAGVVDSPFTQSFSHGAWRRLAAPERQPDSALSAVSCASTSRCIAVGNDIHTGVPFSDGWNGRTWRLLPAQTDPVRAVLNALSCAAAASCIAVGITGNSYSAHSALAESWNGTAWTRMAPISPPAATSSSFAAISCADATHCMAVGQYVTQSGGFTSDLPLAETWDGSAWTLLTPPAGSSGLAGVSCPTASQCLAVGDRAFAAVWNGSTWTTLSDPVPANPFPGLLAVSCAAASTCVALGVADAGWYSQSWTGGTSLTMVGIGDRSGQPLSLASISCARPATCMAVGGTDTLTFPQFIPLAESWNGQVWRGLRTQQVDALADVSCAARSACMAVGTYTSPAADSRVLAQAWNGSRWQLVGMPGLFGGLSQLSCTGRSFCMAAGPQFAPGVLAEAWNGTRWRAVRSPGSISLLTCLTRRFCLALGFPGALKWNGSRWRAVPEPAKPARSTSHGIGGISCTRPTYCMAVGSYTTDPHGGINVPLVEIWNGARWKIMRAPDPGPNAALNSVACVRGAGCMAVGAYDDSSNVGHNLAMRWNGRRWRVFKLPGVLGYGSGQINGLSGPTDIACPSLASCMAVGNVFVPRNTSGVGLAYNLAIAWNGIKWRLTQPVGRGGGLATVACAAPGHCIAVGQAGRLTLAERWNGRSWSLLRTENP